VCGVSPSRYLSTDRVTNVLRYGDSSLNINQLLIAMIMA